MLDGNMLESLGWYFLGVFSLKIGTSIFRQAQAMNVFEEAINYSLTALKISHENLLAMQEIKIESMKNSGMEEKLVIASRKVDREFVDAWETASIYSLKKSVPAPFRHIVGFKSWFQAMRFLDKRLKKK